MKFCNVCDNMYYISISERNNNIMVYSCRNCGNIDESVSEEGACVLKTQLKKGGQSFQHIVNKYTKLDPTLPRIYNIKCCNTDCITNQENSKKTPEIIYIRYDDENMKYLYICVDCDTTWKTDDKK